MKADKANRANIVKAGRVAWVPVLALITTGAIGCAESGGRVADPLGGPVDDALAMGAGAYLPDMSEIRARVALRPEQADLLQAAVAELRDELQARARQRLERQDRQELRESLEPRELPEPREPRERPGQQDRRRARGASPDMAQRPGVRFIERCAVVLEPDQLVDLLALLGERREAWRAERAARLTRSDRPAKQAPRGAAHKLRERRLEQVAADLDLTAAQREAVAAALRRMDAELRAIRAEGRTSGRTPELAERRASAAEALRADLAAILTPAQLAGLEERREERRGDRGEHRERLRADRGERWTASLTAILRLDEPHSAAVAEILAGSPSRQQAHDAIRAQLNERQARVFDALVAWLPQPGWAVGPAR